ncbi:MAG: RNA polymerase sigma factor [Ferruginibacter sp.]
MTDSELAYDIVNGDNHGFETLVKQFQEKIFRTVMGFVHNKEDAEELTQDIFIKAYYALNSFKGKSTLSTWLYRIAVNTSISFLRKKKRKEFWGRFPIPFNTASNDKNAADQLAEDEEIKVVRKAIEKLPLKQSMAFVLSKYEDLPQKKVAEIMQVTEGAVEQLLIRARLNLRKWLEKNHLNP